MELDRYALFCIAVSLVILTTTFFSSGEVEDDGDVGVVFDITETKNGYTFFFEDQNGNRIRCFNRTMPEEGGVYSIKGTASDDGTMFFVSSMLPLHSE